MQETGSNDAVAASPFLALSWPPNKQRDIGDPVEILRETHGVCYSLFKLGDLDEMALVLAGAFSEHEPMARACGCSQRELVDFVKLFGPLAARERLTPIARDVATGRIIGAFLSEDFTSPAPEGFDRVSERLRPILTLLACLDDPYREGKAILPGRYLHLFMIGVAREFTGRDVGQNLLACCLENGVRRGYVMAVTEATGTVSQSIFRQAGFTERRRVEYTDYVFEGHRVFQGIEGHIGTLLMDKALGPSAGS
jgi:ribosomal protein S18 acetylase RimI-like enzyme